MATLVLTAVGALVGGPVGGLIGAFAGQQVDAALFAPKAREGARLKDLAIQTSSYGTALPRHYGRMRTAGSVIWATDLKETREKSGGGKGRPKLVSYSYSSSIAVALGSRPIRAIGRIWADGSLLRGAAGDLKVGGSLRLHHGHGDQEADPLIAAAEGPERCPAFRNLAYLVLEDLALADFGNRLPALTVEVIADDGVVLLAEILSDALPEADVAGAGTPVSGYSVEGGNAAALVEAIGALVPLACVDTGAGLTIREAEGSAAPADTLPEPLAVSARDDEAPRPALALRTQPTPAQRDVALRYYDIDRDYQPGLQRASGRSQGGEPATIEFPAALTAAAASLLADAVARQREAGRDTATVRIAAAVDRFAPGARVRIPGAAGSWLVESWELDDKGVELGLRRIRRRGGNPATSADPGRANLPPDLSGAETVLAAFELPWDGIGSPADTRLFAAASSPGAGWTGAALFAEREDGSLDPLGGSGRTRATIGRAETVLPPAPAALADLASALVVRLAADDLVLTGASAGQLAAGVNRALVGSELIQFARATALGDGRWRLDGLLRGRGGTEWAVAGHGGDEPFVLIDETLTALDAAVVGPAAHARIAAIGLVDAAPVRTPILLPGASLEPLSAVHGRIAGPADGSIALTWVRRARGAWLWRDGVDVPLVEQEESYLVEYGASAGPAMAQWIVPQPSLVLDPATLAALRAEDPGGRFQVRQRGDHGLSRPLPLGALPA